jgi:MoxR-like ATPase
LSATVLASGVTTSSATDLVATVTAQADSRGLCLDPDLLIRIVAALRNTNVRLMGAPGTGKSTLAEILLQAHRGDEWDFALATGQWTGEDIVGGPVPDPNDPTRLIFQPGLVLAAADADRWVGIDEMNRADIDAAFGELFSLLAGFDTTLPYTVKAGSTKRVKIYAERPTGALDEGEYGLPRSWRMIATMNSWDKASLARVSFAFSRRWCTIHVPVPDPPTYETIIDQALLRYPAASSYAARQAVSLLFCEDVPGSLRRLGLALGPGIAISCLRDIASSIELGLSEDDAVIAAVEGFVLPQFEGQLEMNDEIAAALVAAVEHVEATEDAKTRMRERLAVFTGQRSSLIF